jgi:hypothetical protein
MADEFEIENAEAAHSEADDAEVEVEVEMQDVEDEEVEEATAAPAPAAVMVGWCPRLVTAIDGLGLFDDMLVITKPVEAYFRGARQISAATFTSLRIELIAGSGQKVTMKLTSGEERSTAVEVMSSAILAHAGTLGIDTSLDAIAAILATLIGKLAPEGSAMAFGHAVPAGAGPNPRSGSPAVGSFARQAVAIVNEQEKAATARREMPRSEVLSRHNKCSIRYGIFAPKLGDIAVAQQLKHMDEDLNTNGVVPAHAAAQPLKVVAAFAGGGVLSKKPEKDKDIEAGEAKSVAEGKKTIAVYVNSVGVVSVDNTDGEDIFQGALTMLKAVNNAEHITSVEVLTSVMNTAMGEAMSACAGDYDAPKSIGDSYRAAARTIHKANNDLGIFAVANAKKQKTETGANNVDGSSFPADLRTLIDSAKKKAKSQGAAADKDSKKTVGKALVPGEGYKKFAIMAGGNPDCPVDCTKASCKKADRCFRNHQNK